MKIVLSLRSEAAFNLVVRKIQLSSKLYGIKLPKENVEKTDTLEDYINFFQADLYIIDRSLPESKSMIDLVIERELEHLIIDDIRSIDTLLEKEYGNEEIEQTFKPIIEEKQQVKVETKVIEKEIYVSKYQAVPHRFILVGSLYSNAGSTTVSMNIARMIAERGLDVTYIENPLSVPRMFDYLQIGFRVDQYTDIAQEIKYGSIPDADIYKYKGVQWVVNDPNKERIKSFTFEEFNLLQQITRSTITILDVSNHFHEPEIIKLAQIADEVILVMEANPIKNEYHILNKDKNQNVFTLLQNNHVNYKILLTKTSIKGIDIKVVKEMLPQRTFIDLPYIKYEYLIKNLFDTTIFYDDSDSEGKEFIENNLKEILNNLLPREFINLKENKSLLNKLFLRRS